jgi:hypothetical protein
VGYARTQVAMGLVQDHTGALQKALLAKLQAEGQAASASSIAELARHVEDDMEFWKSVHTNGCGRIAEGNSRMATMEPLMGIEWMRADVLTSDVNERELHDLIEDRKAGEHSAMDYTFELHATNRPCD